MLRSGLFIFIISQIECGVEGPANQDQKPMKHVSKAPRICPVPLQRNVGDLQIISFDKNRTLYGTNLITT